MRSRFPLGMRCRRFALIVFILLTGCGDDGESTQAQPIASTRADESSAEENAGSEQEQAYLTEMQEYRQALEALRVHTDLMEMRHLAEIEERGLVIDFGTPARMKYTTGRWNNDWGDDGTQGERTFTALNDVGSVYFSRDRVEPLRIEVRLRKVNSPSVIAYLNGETLRTIDLEEGEQTYRLTAPADLVRAGENQLRFRASETSGDVSAEFDWIRVAGESEPAATESPRGHSDLQRPVELGGLTRPALVIPASGVLTWYLDIPQGGRLALSAATQSDAVRMHVTATVAGRSDGPQELFDETLSARWQRRLLPLDAYAGEVVRLQFRVEGDSGEAALSGLAIMTEPPPPLPEPARNVIVLTIDTLRASKLRTYNRQSRVRTPVLDQFASESFVFEQAQSPENWTKPSVASILTSLWPMTHRTKDEAARLPDRALMVSEVYQQADFSTASFLANGYVSDRFGFGQGWDHYRNYIREQLRSEAQKVFDEAGDWIEQHRDERFFVYIQTIDPHVIYDPPEQFLRMYDESDYSGQVQPHRTAQLLADAKRRPPRVTFDEADRRRLEALHDGEISYHDFHLGRFIERLKELGLYEDLIFVVTSDHGEEFDDHGSWGHGHSVYQELLHVPLIVRWPAVGTEAVRLRSTVSTMDIAPTVLLASGLPVPDEFEGRSLIDYMRIGSRPGPSVAFSDFLDDRRVIRAGRWKLILRGNLTWTMFDLERDPGERRQLDAENADPIGLRYTRIMLGEFLGATDRRNWWTANDGEDRTLPSQITEVDSQLCQQLAALGYVDPRCESN